jgi:hypothetical protein
MVVWSSSGLEACLVWSYVDVIVVRIKVSRGIVPFPPMGIDSAGIIIYRPIERLVHGQITFTSK